MPSAVSATPSEVTVLSATVELTDAQIKALPTTPVIIVPATETLNYVGLPGRLPLPLAFSISLDPSEGAYTNVNSPASWVLALGSDWSSDAMISSVDTMCQLEDVTPQIGICNSYSNAILNSLISALRINAGGLQDNALALAVRNGEAGNLTGGDAANTLKVTVLYTIIDV